MIKVALLEENIFYRTGIAHTVNHRKNIEYLGGVKTLEELPSLLVEQPDVLILGLELSNQNLSIIEGLCMTYPKVKIILTPLRTDNFNTITDAISIGAHSVLNKRSLESSALGNAIVQACMGYIYIDKTVGLLAMRSLYKRNGGIVLNLKEQSLLNEIVQGKTTKEIAQSLMVKHRTIEDRIDTLRKKAGAKTLIGLVTFAFKNNLITSY